MHAYEEVADCSVRLFVGQVMGGFNPHQPPPEYATVLLELSYFRLVTADMDVIWM